MRCFQSITNTRSVGRIFALLAILMAGSGCQGTPLPQQGADMAPTLGLVRSAKWQAGLRVIYLPGKFRHTEEMPSGDSQRRLGRPGAPILSFNHNFGRSEVFASGKARGIGMEAYGYIHMDQPGVYRFKALSNDGIRVWIADRLVVDDGEWHMTGDRYSTPISIENPQAGWAAVRLRYFQRKGTATLKLLWQPPGSDEFEVIPAAAYAHSPPTS